MKTYSGSCHCGAVQCTVEADITEAMQCNCSHCKRKGFLLTFIPKEQFTLVSGAEDMTTYLFNKKHINHQFCKHCGVQVFGSAGDTVALNLTCVDDIEMDEITINQVDGKNSY